MAGQPFGRLGDYLRKRRSTRRPTRKLRRVVVQGHVYYVRPPTRKAKR
jgi:hypothetical protein